MGLKFLLTFMIGLIVSVSLLVELTNKADNGMEYTKDLEFTDTTFVEVDTQRMQGWAFGTFGVHDKGILTLDNIVFHTDNIESLIAKKGTFLNDIIYLDGDVVMQEKDGYTYKTQHANYNQKTEILNITSPFTAVQNENILEGETLRYDTVKKETNATQIDAVFYTTDK